MTVVGDVIALANQRESSPSPFALGNESVRRGALSDRPGNRAGSSGEKLLRAGSGFWRNTLLTRLERAGGVYSISSPVQKGVKQRVAPIPGGAGTCYSVLHKGTSVSTLSLPELKDKQGPDLPRVILTSLGMTLE